MLTYNILIEGQTIPVDEAIGKDDEMVRRVLAPYYPDAANAMITRTTKDDVVTVNVVKRAGTKGKPGTGQSPLQKLARVKGGRNTAVALYLELREIPDPDPEALLAMDRRIEAAIQAGAEEGQAVEKARKRLDDARPQPAKAIVVGF